MSHGSKLDVDLLCQQNETDIKSGDDWLAVKAHKYNTNELVNIVSLSVEMEKITIVTREHNRVVTDDINTKQWYGVYTVEQLYLIHQHFCQIDSVVDQYYPDQLRPIKGYISTYFNNNLSQTVCNKNSNEEPIDLQDNFLCNLIRDYLSKCIECIGVNLYVDILFNDLSSNDYFEIYSEFNLKRLQDDIDAVKRLFEKIRPLDQKAKRIQKIDLKNEDFIWEFKRTLRNILQFYSQEDRLISQLLLLYAEYYNNLLKPLIDSNELAKKKLVKFENKLANQIKTNKFLPGQSNIDALKELEEMVKSTEQEIFDLSNDIDLLCIQYKQNIIDMYVSMQENIKHDKFQFYLPKNNPFYCFFETIVNERFSRNEDEILEKKLQIYKTQLGCIERKVKRLNDNEKNSIEIKYLKIKIFKKKLKIYSEEESILKKSLIEIKNEGNNSVSSNVYNLAKELGEQYLDELKESYKVNTSMFLVEKNQDLHNNADDSSDSDDDYLNEDTKFFDAYETPDKLFEEENKEKNEKTKKINDIKKKILNIGSKKSSIRLALKKLEETSDYFEEVEKPAEPTIKTFAMKKEEDRIQKEICMENRNKALQRLKEYKTKKLKDSGIGSMSSLNSISKQTETEKPAKKLYIPKSKQRILPPNFGQKVKIFKKEENTLPDSQNMQEPSKVSSPPPLPELSSSFNSSIKSSEPPPPPPLIGLQIPCVQPCTLPISVPLPPPPPPPLDLLSNNSVRPTPPPPPLLLPFTSEKNAKSIENSKTSENRKENVQIEFDINEIKTFKFKKSTKSPPKKEKSSINQFNSWETLMNEIRNNGGRKLKNITNETSNRKTKCDLDLPHKSKLELDLTSILSERSKFFNLDDEDGSDSDASWDN